MLRTLRTSATVWTIFAMDSNPRQIGQIPSGQRFRETSPPPRCLMRIDLHGTGFTRPYIHAGTTTYLQHRTRGVVSVVSITKHYTMDSQHAHQPQSNGGRHVTGLLRYVYGPNVCYVPPQYFLISPHDRKQKSHY